MRIDDRFAVGRTSGYVIPDGNAYEVEYVVHDRADASRAVGRFVAAGRAGTKTLDVRTLHASRMARRLASELNARERGQPFDPVVVDALPRFVRFPRRKAD